MQTIMHINSQWSQDAYVKAWDFATLAHHGQYYSTPQAGVKLDYINHIGAVAMELMAALAASATDTCQANLALQCALLHDVLEDTEHTHAELMAEFGQAVADGVQALSKNPKLPKDQQMADSLARICQQPKAVWMVKLADRINNLSTPPYYWTLQKKRAYQEEARLIHEHLHTANAFLAARLQMKIDGYERYFG